MTSLLYTWFLSLHAVNQVAVKILQCELGDSHSFPGVVAHRKVVVDPAVIAIVTETRKTQRHKLFHRKRKLSISFNKL